MSVWDAKAGWYDALRSLPVFKQIYHAELRNVRKLLPDRHGQTHLDIGTGTGASLEAQSAAAFCVVCDRSRKMLKLLRENRTFVPVQLDAGAPLPFRSSAFDVVTAIGLTEYLQNVQSLFAEVHRVTKPGAYFLTTSSPPGLLTTLRCLTGSRAHKRTHAEVRNDLEHAGWIICQHKKSLMQEQWLCRKAAET